MGEKVPEKYVLSKNGTKDPFLSFESEVGERGPGNVISGELVLGRV